MKKHWTARSFIAFMGLAYNILTPAKAISRASYDLRRGNAAAERVMEILDYQSFQIQEKPNAIDKPNFEHSMVLKNITFCLW
ncbi:hypothetical protein CCAN12_610010 [Capnocytophaga canimorsus]|uniref:Uncharacterized protein n=1 Tax=Capnocytophaga canimorsus TaxID=28188 RepID=A0A0B7H6Z1_9FLAO|nr:hypothetical protein CCAN12_610010 [Capnocytophaga canimorsus]